MTKTPKVAVVGSYNTDLMSRTPRMPGPGETILGGPFRMGPGGKGSNQAVAAVRLGAEVAMVCRLGNDVFGDFALETLQKEGVDTRFSRRDATKATGAALIVVDAEGENSIVVAPGANESLGPDDVNHAADAITGADVVLTQLEIPVESVHAVLQLARASGVRTVLNPAPARPLSDSLLEQVDVLTPNRGEAALLTGRKIDDRQGLVAAAGVLMDRGVGAVVFTLGGEGALLVAPQETVTVPAHKVDVVDTTGAGDAFNGALAVSLARGESLEEAVRFAVAAAALSVTKVGTAPAMPRRIDVDRFLDSVLTEESYAGA